MLAAPFFLLQSLAARAHHTSSRYALNCSKLEGLGWKQRTAFEDGLNTTLEWYMENGGKPWASDACDRALLPHSHLDGRGDLSGVPWSVQEMEDVEDVLRSAGVF